MTTITALPTPPSRADSTNFSTRGDAFLGALPTFVTEANAVGSEATAAAAAAAASASAAAASQSTASTAAAAVAAQSPVANAAAAAASAAAAAASAAAAAQTSGAVAATTLSASSTVSGTGFSTYLASPPAIGGAAPAAVSATALSYTTTLTGGTGIVNLGSGQVYKDASGNVGIGTSSPTAKLDVNGAITGRATSGGEGGQIDFNNPDNLSVGLTLDVGSADTGRLFQNRNNSVLLIGQLGGTGGSISLFTAASERMRIDSSGNVGIGTSSPGAKLDVLGAINNSASTLSTNDAATLDVRNSSGAALQIKSKLNFGLTDGSGLYGYATVAGAYTNYNGSGDIGTSLIFGTQFNAAGGSVERMRIDSSGNVGIGTSSPTANLDVRAAIGSIAVTSSTGTNHAKVQINNTGGSFQLGIENSAGSNYGAPAYSRVLWNDGAYPTVFYTNSTEKMRIDSSGNVTVSTAALLGYGTGSGGTVTQATSKSTAVTLNKPTGQISVNNSALGANVSAVFTFNNTLISASDVLLISRRSNGIALDSYSIDTMCGSGVAYVAIRNITAGSLSESLELSFAVIKGSTT